MRVASIATLLLLTLTTWSCRDHVVYQQQVKISPNGWGYLDTVSFEFGISDTVPRYDIDLQIGHSDRFGHQNVYLKFLTHFPDGHLTTQVLSVDLADHTGAWYGERRGGRVVATVNLQQRAVFNQTGRYRLEIVQHMRQGTVSEIEDLELVIKPS